MSLSSQHPDESEVLLIECVDGCTGGGLRIADGIAHSNESMKQSSNTELVYLHTLGCKTAEEALHYILDRRLSVANFAGFSDLEERHLEKLFSTHPAIEHLIVQSDRIEKLPEKAPKLHTLDCGSCHNLLALPESYTGLKRLSCRACVSLSSLPETYTQIQRLNCSWSQLSALPSTYTLLQYLQCIACHELCFLPETYTRLYLFFCDGSALYCLPDSYTQLEQLHCSNTLISTIPKTYTKLKILDCEELVDLTSLPDSFSQLKSLNCRYCKNLSSIPDTYTQLEILHCEECDKLIVPDVYAHLI